MHGYCRSARELLHSATSKMLAVFPLADDVLKLAPIVLPENRLKYTGGDLSKLAQKLSVEKLNIQALDAEWLDYQPAEPDTSDLESFWGKQAKEHMPNLTMLMRAVMVLPH